jgi:hypothetical protein
LIQTATCRFDGSADDIEEVAPYGGEVDGFAQACRKRRDRRLGVPTSLRTADTLAAWDG